MSGQRFSYTHTRTRRHTRTHERANTHVSNEQANSESHTHTHTHTHTHGIRNCRRTFLFASCRASSTLDCRDRMSSLHASSVYGCICAANRMGNTDDDDTDDDGYSDTTMSTHIHTQNGQLLSLLPTHISFMSRMYALDIITPCTSPSSSPSLPLLPKQIPTHLSCSPRV